MVDKKDKITATIIQLATPNIDEYAVYSISSIYEFARRNGYGLHVQREKSIDDLHINWSKIDAIIRTMEECQTEYTVLFDADTIIVNFKRTLNDFLAYGREDSLIYMPQDTPFFTGFFQPNAGFIIVKNDDDGKALIKRWLHAAYNEGRHLNDIHPRNQRVYWKYVMPHYKRQQVLLPRRYFSKPLFSVPYRKSGGGFLYHVTQTKNVSRSLRMQQLYDRFVGDQEIVGMVSDRLLTEKSGVTLFL